MRRGDLALVAAAICFGTTFVIVQDAVEVAGPVPFIAVRFLLAALVLWPIARRRPPTAGELRSGLLGGTALVTGYLLQTIGLQYTGSATSAFITYMLVVFVPVLGFVALRRRVHPVTIVGIAVAVVGLVLLTNPSGAAAGNGFGRGELLTLGCAVAFAAHVVILGETSRQHDPIRLATIQVTVVGVVCVVPGFWLGGYRMPSSALVAAASTALLATALALVLQVTGQRTVPPARAALLLLIEPVSAAGLAATRGDGLAAGQGLGALLILAAVLLAEVLPGWLDQRVNTREAGLDNDRSRRVG